MTVTKKYVRIKKATVDGVWYADKIGQIFEVVRENSVAILTKCGGHHSVLREDAEVIVTEKRPAEAGERVLITYAAPIEEQAYEKGDVFVAESTNDPVHKCVRVLGMPEYIDYTEYEVIVENEVKFEEADEMKNGKTRYDLAVENAREAIEELRLAAYEQGYEDAKRRIYTKAPIVSAQARRDEIVEQAKADVEKLSNYGDGVRYVTGTGSVATCNVEFVVNSDKRTVVALLKGLRTGKVYAKGIAKATPDDCFNVHIGKSIALRRALGLAVPDECLNAPQPTEVRVGDVVQYSKRCATVVAGRPNGFGETKLTSANGLATRIIDDSREEVIGE
ncbi:hypothetical protein [Bacillus velezensis]|uniref:hypothetical protein n=1 Tax=Bacillus velezensis TaxID=492670 RepID=UPI0024AED73B|nr:hypothetical protein [Bacillus velezensis]WHM14842.1 hypothetical protein QLX65_07040 [Bacillus velezensis]